MINDKCSCMTVHISLAHVFIHSERTDTHHQLSTCLEISDHHLLTSCCGVSDVSTSSPRTFQVHFSPTTNVCSSAEGARFLVAACLVFYCEASVMTRSRSMFGWPRSVASRWFQIRLESQCAVRASKLSGRSHQQAVQR